MYCAGTPTPDHEYGPSPAGAVIVKTGTPQLVYVTDGFAAEI